MAGKRREALESLITEVSEALTQRVRLGGYSAEAPYLIVLTKNIMDLARIVESHEREFERLKPPKK